MLINWMDGWMDRRMDSDGGTNQKEETGLFQKGTRSLEESHVKGDGEKIDLYYFCTN